LKFFAHTTLINAGPEFYYNFNILTVAGSADSDADTW